MHPKAPGGVERSPVAAAAYGDAGPPAELAEEAAAVFGGALPQARAYAALLGGAGVERGIIGPAEAGRIWERHLLNCAVIARLVPAHGTLIDIGSGGGLPGVVLALLLPGLRVTLLEPMARRVAFLQECVAELSLPNAEIVRGRAEDMRGQLAADLVTARAVAPLGRLASLAAGVLKPGGRVVAMKGASAESELASARTVLARLGARDARVVRVASASGQTTATVVAFAMAGSPAGGPAARRVPGRPATGGAGPRQRRS